MRNLIISSVFQLVIRDTDTKVLTKSASNLGTHTASRKSPQVYGNYIIKFTTGKAAKCPPHPKGVYTDWQAYILYVATLIKKWVMTDFNIHPHIKFKLGFIQ